MWRDGNHQEDEFGRPVYPIRLRISGLDEHDHAAYMLGTWDARYPHVSSWTKMLLLGALISTRDQGCLDGHERASQVLVWEAIPIAW